ncbi:ATP-binding protein [Bacteroides heparinolyticus]|uniref:ATP-binding protein n=1 Tax=Prevotella heparinolytica TaxID=28113 RepID=UPI0035A00469
MYLKRKIDLYLEKWKSDENKKPLMVKGPRQVGKTESIMNFAKSAYKSIIYINFVEEPKYKTITGDGYSAADIIKNITLLNPEHKIINGETLIFFDEIQDFPEIATSLKFFCISGVIDVICSGSMLGINYKKIESNSVGYKEDLEMQSFDFEEFLWARGYDEDVRADMLGKMQEFQPFSETEMSVFTSLFLEYAVLGGMPAVVRDFVTRKNFEGSIKTQRQLLMDYAEDMRKYADGLDQTRILNVFRHIPVQLAKENKKFQISKVAKGARFRDYRGALEWLEDAGIINICYALNYPELPFMGNYDESRYKVYMADTGLLVAMLDDETQTDLRAGRNLGIYKGALYENIVAEALKKSGYRLFYYKKSDSSLEEDFFVRTQDALIPIEVKSGDNRSKSLRTLITSDSYPDIKFGIKLSSGNIGRKNGIVTFPLFCAFLLKDYL